MKLEYDPVKNQSNIDKHGVSFDDVAGFDFDTALFEVDTRFDYGEERINSLGFLDSRLHVLTFVIRDSAVRPISFRKANKREVTRYDAQQI